jgi:hypothetical protein
MPPRPIPPSILVALGLAACGPCLDIAVPTDTDDTDTDTDTGVGPCLSPPLDTGDTDTGVGPCLDVPPPDTGVGPCLSPPLDTGDTSEPPSTADTAADPDTDAPAAFSGARRDALIEELVRSGVLPADVAARLRGSGG